MHLQALVVCLLAALPIEAAYSSEGHWPNGHPWKSHLPSPTSASGCASATSTSISPQSTEWSGWGGNIYNNRWASDNSDINSSSVASLVQHCRIDYSAGVSATPTLSGAIAYYPTWSGLLVALNYETCQVQWQLNVTQLITDFAPISKAQSTVTSAVSRSSPQLDGEVLYFGTLIHALLFAVDVKTGTVLGSMQIDSNPLSILTMSPTVYNSRIFIGTASQEELASAIVPGFQCCSFVGHMFALTFDHTAGQFSVAWNVSMLPRGNWSGAAIWGSQPSIDPARSQVFIATGNVYNLPEEYQLCQNQSMDIAVVAQGLTTDPCLPRDVLQESIIALDIDTGLINWVNQLSPLDAYVVACGYAAIPTTNPANCPFTPGPDADFGMAPTFIPGSPGTPYGKDTVVVGQKNGNLYALSAQAGRVFWSTVTSPDGGEGGLIWGVAVDATQIYFTAVNSGNVAFQLQPSNLTISNSAFGSASLANGSILWEVQSPPNTSLSLVPPSVVNDVVFFGRTGNNLSDSYTGAHGALFLLDKYTGAVVREVDLDANFHGSVAIQDKWVLFGTGYQGYTGNGSFYVMTV